ncbi:hypothetical protein [Ruoffia sp. FAM 20857]|uniref:hypothetical protein n=1 Tax=Ruoffia sp. FAM 20857 TaxID=3259515 RepID=UPI0038844321
MDEKFVYAVYDRIEEANKAVQNLTDAGIPVSAISLYADDDVVEEANQSASVVELEEYDDDDDHRSFWNRIADFFGSDDGEDENFPVDLKGYQNELDDDKILVVVEKTYEGEALSVDTNVNVMEENDPNQVETFTQRNDYPTPDETTDSENATVIAGDMGAETDYSKEHQKDSTQVDSQVYPDDRQYTVTENVQYDESNKVAGDTARESEEAEAYYTNLNKQPQTDRDATNRSSNEVTYIEDPVADEKLLADRKEGSVAGDIGDSSDYSQYYQENQEAATPTSSTDYHDEDDYLKGEETSLERESEGRRSDFMGVGDSKRPVSNRSNNDPRMGEFEDEMRRHDDNPPADEEGVNPEQYGAEDKSPQNFNTLSPEDTNGYADQEEGHPLGEFEDEMRRHDDNPPADEEGVNADQYEDDK